jgi:hypothetical protein
MDFRNYLFGRIGTIVLFAVMMAMFAVPASAGTLYSNGTFDLSNNGVNGQYDSWNIFGGEAVADSFTLSADSNLSGVNFGVWVLPTDKTPTSIDWAIIPVTSLGTDPNPFSVAYSATQASLATIGTPPPPLFVNNYGYGIDEEQFNLNVALGAGTYYLVLQGAQGGGVGGVFWDENDGPSIAYDNIVGSTKNYWCDPDGTNCADWAHPGSGSETFEILGTSVPEPGTLTLLGTGLFFLVGRRRRTSR